MRTKKFITGCGISIISVVLGWLFSTLIGQPDADDPDLRPTRESRRLAASPGAPLDAQSHTFAGWFARYRKLASTGSASQRSELAALR